MNNLAEICVELSRQTTTEKESKTAWNATDSIMRISCASPFSAEKSRFGQFCGGNDQDCGGRDDVIDRTYAAARLAIGWWRTAPSHEWCTAGLPRSQGFPRGHASARTLAPRPLSQPFRRTAGAVRSACQSHRLPAHRSFPSPGGRASHGCGALYPADGAAGSIPTG